MCILGLQGPVFLFGAGWDTGYCWDGRSSSFVVRPAASFVVARIARAAASPNPGA